MALKHSYNAEAVAHDVIDTIKRGVKVNLKEIILRHGYSMSAAKAHERVVRTYSYQTVIKQALPKMVAERARIIEAMQKKDLNKLKYNTLLTGLDILSKNINLLSGQSTENVAIKIEISEQIANKNASKSDDNNINNENSQKDTNKRNVIA